MLSLTESVCCWFCCIPWPWKHRFCYFFGEIRSCFLQVIRENPILHNGGTNLHIEQIAQGCQSVITRILIIDPSKISKQQKKPCIDGKSRLPLKSAFHIRTITVLRFWVGDSHKSSSPLISILFEAYVAHQGLVPGRSSYTNTDESVIKLTLNSWAPRREIITTTFKHFCMTRPRE